MKPKELKPIIDAVLAQYVLPLNGDHGVAHWARVFTNGHKLASQTEANIEVVSLFAVFHDSRRFNESVDPHHGHRGAELAVKFRGDLFELTDEEFALLYAACDGHTHERTHPDITVQTCFDSDRLDLGRVWITPDPNKLCTEAAKSREMIQWADGRSSFKIVPEFVADDWGIDVPKQSVW